jgi:signal transduction histidine kinase
LQKKVAVILLLIVLLPVGLLAWLGLRMAHNEQRVAAAQVQELVQSQLGSVDDSINVYFRTLQDDWMTRLSTQALDAPALAQLPQELGGVQQAFVIGADGKRVYPSPTAELSESEKQFLQRTAALWDNPGLLSQGAALGGSVGSANSLVSKRYNASTSSTSTNTADAGPAQRGWYTWHWNAELHHIFWLRDAQNRLVGVELTPVALVADLIALLPSTPADGTQATQTKSRTRLVNGNGQVVYEWGAYQPASGEKMVAMRPLSHPLGTWKLEYFAPALATAGVVNTWSMVAGLLGLALALVGLALYLYREHTREMRLAQQRVNFVNQVSHELKTPLTNIRLYAELLENEVDPAADEQTEGSSKAHRYLGIITAESQRLSRLIANVLSLGQFQKAQFKLALQHGVVDEVVARCIAAFRPALQAKSITVQFTAQAPRTVMLDAQALEQILNNLLSNAEKYAASGGAIHIDTTQAQGVSTIDVRDFGPGIPASERERVFEPFYRVSSKLTDGVAGTGIGLDIARQLARQHGGDVTLQTTEANVVGVGVGAHFRVSLRTEFVEPTP